MMINVDLLGLACAEYCEHNGVKGVFIPEVPNFRYKPGTGFRKGETPARAMVSVSMLKANKQSQKYDWMGRQVIPKEHLDAYMANPNTVSRKRWCAYAYNFMGRNEGPERVSTSADLKKLLDD